MTVAKLCGAALVALTVLLLLRQMKAELAPLAGLGAGVLLISGAFALALPTLQTLLSACEAAGAKDYAKLLLQVMGVALLSETTADFCRDAGESALAGKVELVGKAGILAVSTPMLGDLLAFAKNLLLS